MKRRSLKFIACAAIMAMTLSVTACGGSDDAASSAETEETVEEETETETEAEPETETEAEPEAEDEAEAEPETEEETEGEDEAEAEDESADDASAAGETLESIFNDPTTKSQYETIFDAMAQDGMSVGIEAVGNELAVIIKLEDSSLVVDGMGEALESALDQQAATFEAMAEQLDTAIGTTNECTVVLRYLDPDDNVLAEKSFQAQ